MAKIFINYTKTYQFRGIFGAKRACSLMKDLIENRMIDYEEDDLSPPRDWIHLEVKYTITKNPEGKFSFTATSRYGGDFITESGFQTRKAAEISALKRIIQEGEKQYRKEQI